jgi:hypothetical protein
MLNRLIHKAIFTSEIIPYNNDRGLDEEEKEVVELRKTELKYEVDGVPNQPTYDHYKARGLQK